MSRMHQEISLPPVDAANHRVYVNLPSGHEDDLMNKELSGGFPPYKIFARMLFPAFAKARMKSAYAQTVVDEAMVACGLERVPAGARRNTTIRWTRSPRSSSRRFPTTFSPASR